MINQSFRPTEEDRLAALRRYRILDTPRESDFDDLVKLAAEICQTPISLVSLVDLNRQWFKGSYGLDIIETPRRLSFCSHAIKEPESTMVVPDATKDPRFFDNELVTGGPGIRFYAGVPLVTPEGHALGTLCVIDRKPRELSEKQKEALQVLSRQVLTQLELRRRVAELSHVTEQLRETNVELEGFFHAISHDLRAPLRAVIGFGEMLIRQHANQLDSSGAGLLRQIESNSRRATELLDDFIKLLRLRNQSLQVGPVHMQQLAQEVAEELRPLSPSAQYRIRQLPSVKGDRGLLRQVWVNLLSNALKFSRKQSEPVISISAEEQPTRVAFAVNDNGTGFDMREADHLWTPFHRLHGREFEGTGLGLSVVRRVIQRHGGEVWAEGTPGQGATFHFSLPRNG